MFKHEVIAIAGSRSLSSANAKLVKRVVGSLVQARCNVVVGCATGVDEAALSVLPSAAGKVFAAFGPGGQGACRWSAVSSVSRFAAQGGCVSWWAGGGPRVLLPARLSARTRVVASSASGLVAFFASPASRGTALACRVAASHGSRVVVFPLGFAGVALPSLGAGRWVPCNRRGLWSGAWAWEADQASFF